MKFQIELTDAEVKGIKNYLKDVDDVKPTKPVIAAYLQNIVTGVINAPQEAVSDYIKAQE